ncbi:MAG: GHKL domain-containing protein [Defluviitaleaceae bacterium]|nr:GHKL domain-containing protein [Defluviitaleaceae bacterium]
MNTKISFDEVAQKPIRVITCIYAIVKAVSYAALGSPYTMHRIGVGAVMIFFVLAVTETERLTRRQHSVIVPMLLVITELIFIAAMGGDRLTYYFLVGVPLLSLLYADISGIFIVMVLTAAIVGIMVFGLEIYLMRYSSFENELFSFIGMIVLYALFFLLSRYSINALIIARNSAEKEAIKKQEEAQFMADYTKTLESGYREMRKFRHDHLNLLHGFAGFIDGDNKEGIKEYLKKNLVVAENSLKVLDKNVEVLQPINIPELKGLLAVKFAQAQSGGIEVGIDIPQPIEDIPLERTDLCRIAGILIENATEELLGSTECERKLLEFGIMYNEGNILIVCANSCKTPPPIEKIFSENYSTKGESRGLGLYNVKRICEKSGNAWVSAHTEDEDKFTVTVTICN